MDYHLRLTGIRLYSKLVVSMYVCVYVHIKFHFLAMPHLTSYVDQYWGHKLIQEFTCFFDVVHICHSHVGFSLSWKFEHTSKVYRESS